MTTTRAVPTDYMHSACRRFLEKFMASPNFQSDILPASRLLNILRNLPDTEDGFHNLTAGWASEAIDLDDEGMIHLRRVRTGNHVSTGRFEARLKDRYLLPREK